MKKVLFILLLLVVALAVIPLFLPKTMHVEEEYTFDAPVTEVYTYFNDLTKFTQFDAWSAKDPDIELNFSNPALGENAYYEWHSENPNLGDGQMKILKTNLNDFILYELKFGEMSGNTAEVIFQPVEGDKTRVVWSFDSGEADYPFQVFNMLMKGTVEKNLYQGLVNLDSLIQKNDSPIGAQQPVDINIVNKESQRLFGVLQQTTTHNEEMSMAMQETFGLVKSYLKDTQNVSDAELGHPVVLWKTYNEEANNALFYCGYIINNNVEVVDDFEFAQIDGGKYLTTIHYGSYEFLSETYAKLATYAEKNELELGSETYDVYLNSPENTPVANLKTQIFIPIIE